VLEVYEQDGGGGGIFPDKRPPRKSLILREA
jgi:hypothetical protein